MLSSPEKPVDKAAEKPAENPAKNRAEKAVEKAAGSVSTSKTVRPPSLGSGNKPVVALVGPPSASKAEAEALLERLRTAVASVQGKSSGSLQSQVFQTPEGWRAAVWPFASREEAQLINATLVGRGLKTRAVDF